MPLEKRACPYLNKAVSFSEKDSSTQEKGLGLF
jgi:hypothetical protein